MNYRNLQTLLRKHSGVASVLNEIDPGDIEGTPPEVHDELVALLQGLQEGATHALNTLEPEGTQR